MAIKPRFIFFIFFMLFKLILLFMLFMLFILCYVFYVVVFVFVVYGQSKIEFKQSTLKTILEILFTFLVTLYCEHQARGNENPSPPPPPPKYFLLVFTENEKNVNFSILIVFFV